MQRRAAIRLVAAVFSLVLGIGVAACGDDDGGSDTGAGDTTTTQSIDQASLDAISRAHGDLHAFVDREFGQAIAECGTSIGCFEGLLARFEGELASLDTVLEHGQEAASGECQIAIEDAQAKLARFTVSVQTSKEALQNYDFGAFQAVGASGANALTFALDEIEFACEAEGAL